jgi:hypothetical protein
MLYLFLCFSIISFINCEVDYIGQTFFSEKPLWYWASPLKLTNFRDGLDLDTKAEQKSLQIVGYFSKTNSPERIAAYFSPIDKRQLVSTNLGSTSYYKRENDIVAAYFKVLSNNIEDVLTSDFKSIINFCPERQVQGLGLNFRYRFNDCYWFDCSLPIESVKTSMGLSERVITPLQSPVLDQVQALPKSEGYTENMTEALSNPLMRYQKIDNRWHKKTGIADIEIVIGRDWNSMECGQLRSFFGAVIPTGNKPNGVYLYEPIVGNNHHWGVTWGAEGIFKSWCLSFADLFVVYDIQSKFLFQNQQRRGVDLIGKPWGRYVWVEDQSSSQEIDFGANRLTLCLNVTPRYQMIINTGVLLKGDCWTFEIGYNFFARAGEEVCLANKWVENIGYVDIEKYLEGEYKTASYSIIQAATGNGISVDIDEDENPIFVPIKACDLNLLSAAHPGMQSQTIYAALEYKTAGKYLDFLSTIGSSYEFNSHNNAPERWTVWGKLGFLF